MVRSQVEAYNGRFVMKKGNFGEEFTKKLGNILALQKIKKTLDNPFGLY